LFRSDPWPSSQTLQPTQLAKMLTDKYSSVPTIVFVGFRSLYVGGHVPNASFHGTASSEQGLAELQSWAATLPRSTDLAIYCGCCPFDKCPNIRPAYPRWPRDFSDHSLCFFPPHFRKVDKCAFRHAPPLAGSLQTSTRASDVADESPSPLDMRVQERVILPHRTASPGTSNLSAFE